MPRLFIAIPVPESVKANLERVSAHVNPRGVRWVNPENMHLTLAFLGDVEERRVPDAEDAVYDATEGLTNPLHLMARGLRAFPNERKAKVLWAGVAGELDALARLQENLLLKLREYGFEPDDKPFRPHITLARFKIPQPLPERLDVMREFGEWEAREVQLIESHLHPSGARYVVRADIPLLEEA